MNELDQWVSTSRDRFLFLTRNTEMIPTVQGAVNEATIIPT